MDEQYISNPRPTWNTEDTEDAQGKRILTLGSNTAGIVIRISKKGVEFNGYYAGLQDRAKYANMREFVLITWDDFDKLREDVFRRRKAIPKTKKREPDKIDKKIDKKYLDGLPKVTLNGRKFYIDVDRQERRPVDNPEQVFNFEKQASKEAT